MNLWAEPDPRLVKGFTALGNHFYSVSAKDDYRNGHVPANFSGNINSVRYRELYAYFQVSL